MTVLNRLSHSTWFIQTFNDFDWVSEILEIWSNNDSMRAAFDNFPINVKVQFMSSSSGRPVADGVRALPFPLDVTC